MSLPIPASSAMGIVPIRTQSKTNNAALVATFGQDAVDSWNEFISYDSLEQQIVALAAMLLAAQNAHNKTYPNAVINRVGIVPNFTGSEMTVTLQLALDPDAVELGVSRGVLAIL